MGNKASLFITLDHGDEQPIVAGNSLKGEVILNVQRKLPAGELVLRLIGTEYTIVPTRKGTKREERTIARAFTKLRNFGGSRKIAKGLYSQPFEFVLPASLPSSTQFPRTETKHFHGRIQYHLCAEIGEFCVDRIFDVVSAPLGDSIVPCIAEPTTHELKQARILSKGFLSVGACVDNSHVGRGQAMKVSVACRNDSKCDIDRIRVKLTEIIEYKAGDESNVLKIELLEMRDVNLPGLQRSRSQDSIRLSKKKQRETTTNTYSEILNDLRCGSNTIQLTVPESARDSYDGNLISISHILKITFHTGGMTVENPSTKIAIVVGSPREGGLDSVNPTTSEPIATIVVEDPLPSEIPDPCDDSTVSVGYDIPMVDAQILPPPVVDSTNTRCFREGNVSLRPARILPYSSDEDGDDDDCFFPTTMPAPSAPHESLLVAEIPRTPPREISGRHTRLGGSAHQNNHSLLHPYAPYTMYNASPNRARDRFDSVNDRSVVESIAESSYEQEELRNRFDSYSYGETTAISDLTDLQDRPQLGHAQLLSHSTPKGPKELFHRLLQELRASIHDYEVVSNKTREAEYRDLYESLTPKEFGLVIATVSMSYQVQVAVLLARHLVYSSSFTSAHCAEALKKTSTYFRTNMVEALVPYVHDLTTHRNLIESELSDWERCVTARAFENMK